MKIAKQNQGMLTLLKFSIVIDKEDAKNAKPPLGETGNHATGPMSYYTIIRSHIFDSN